MMSDPVAGIRLSGEVLLQDESLFGPIRLELPEPGWHCLLGASGVGKSMILRLLAGLDIGGLFRGSIGDAAGRSLAGQCAYMAQSDLLVPWLPVRANIQLGSRLRREPPNEPRTDELLRRVGLADHVDKRPSALSGGMRQRVALARTLLEDRPVVLLDEPFGALDARTRAEMQELAHELLVGRTVLLVTHEPAEAARLADTIHLLTPQGLTALPVPDGSAIRDAASPAVFAQASAMLARLRMSG